jgi:hypothetical protein
VTAKRWYLLAALLALLAAMLSTLIAKRGYSIETMDWNQDGRTSISELIDSMDIETRKVMYNGRWCLEYFRLKDGLPVKTTCS